MGQTAEIHSATDWLPMLRRYFAVVLLGNLVWEIAHLPLYTLWFSATLSEKAAAVAHCTGGDLLIAGACLLFALVVAGDVRWPKVGSRRVAVLTVVTGVGYTAYSEWMNTVVRASWAYADSMPVLPVVAIGLTPLLQWVVVPCTAFWLIRRHIRVS